MSRPIIWARHMFCAASLRCCAMADGCSWLRAAPAACARWRRRCIRGSKTSNRSKMSTARSAVGATRCAPAARQAKPGQVAAVRVLAGQRRADDLRRGILIASISPGLIDTGASRAWLDLTGAPQPDEVAGPLLDLALDPSPHESFYGELVHVGREEPGPFGSVVRSGSIVPWK